MTAQPITSPRPARRFRVLHAPKRTPRFGMWLMTVLLIGGVFFGLIYSQTRLNERAIALQNAERAIETELARMESLQLEVARLQSPSRVAPAAEELGMVFPGERHTLSAPGVIVQSDEGIERLADLKAALGATP